MTNIKAYELPVQMSIYRPLNNLCHENGNLFSAKNNPMETITNTTKKFETDPVVKVKPLIDKLINSVLATSISHRNLIFNDISANAQLQINENKLALVIGNIINNIITLTKDDRLHICYLQSGEIVLRVENTNLSRNKSFVASLDTILIIAERLGIGLKIEEFYSKGSDVSVQFLKKAA